MRLQGLQKQQQLSRWVYTLLTFSALTLLMPGSASAGPKAVGTYTAEDTQAKTLTPPAGKGLVYFTYGQGYSRGNPEISLNGAASLINGQSYILWEVPTGAYRLEASMPEGAAGPKTASYPVEVEAGTVSYYRLLSYIEEEGGSTRNKLYRFVPTKSKDGKKYVNAYALVSWFRDGQRIYYDESRLRQKKPVVRY